MLKLAYSSNAYMNFSVEEAIRRIAALGFAGLELLADVPHAWPAGLLGERKQTIRNCLARHGVEPSEYHLLSDHGVRKRYRTDYDPDEAARVLDELAASLGARDAA